MKPELTHLLQKLKAEHPDFQNLIISHNGVCMAALRFGYRRFESLDALEAYAWPAENVGSTDPVAPSAQDARAASALDPS